MKAIRVQDHQTEGRLTEISAADLTPGDVHIECHYSSLNYKDALAVTNKGKILKKFPLTPGIDVSGVVLSSTSPEFKEGDQVLVTGCGIGEVTDGGFAEEIKVDSSSVIPLPQNMTPKQAMFFGTAGFTAALAVHRLLQNDQTPEKGPILVTGATGGVGSFSIALLSHLGFEVLALTGKKETHKDLLKRLGAHEVQDLNDLHLGSKPLESARFGGAVDNIGGETLSKILAHVQLWGNVASIGLAAGYKIDSTVMPFILRGVSLLGISSNNCPALLRREIWQRLSHDWSAEAFNAIPLQEIPLNEVLSRAHDMLSRKTIGRTLVNIKA